MSRFAPLIAALIVGSPACVFDPPAATPPDGSLAAKDSEIAEVGPNLDDDGGELDGERIDVGMSDGGLENRAPLALADSATIAAGVAMIEIDVLANDSDPDGDPLTILSVDPPASGTAGPTATATILYTPPSAFAGRATFGYRITDGRGNEAIASVEVFVLPDRVTIAPLSAELNLNSRGQFSASGGVPPYVFRISSGTGEVDAASGEFFSADIPGGARVIVEDSIGQSSTATVTYGNGDLFYFGGSGMSGDSSDVFRSNDGTSWSSAGSLPSALYLHGAAVFEDQIFIAGGRNEFFGASEVVLGSFDGASWSVVGSLPRAVRGAPLVVFQRRLVSLGGRDIADVRRDEVHASSDGVNWALVGRLPFARAYGAAFVHDGELWYAGGASEISASSSQVWSSADGTTWTQRGSLPEPRLYLAAAEHDGQMWLMGGSVDADVAVGNTWRSLDGATFSDGSDLPSIRATSCALSWRGALWLVGGGTGLGANPQATNDTLTVAPNGNWADVGSLPAGRYFGAMVIYQP